MRIGIAGWSIPAAYSNLAGGAGTHLVRYARLFNAVEINSSFYRPHRRATYERWSDGVPLDFRFSVKMPKSITHESGLVDADDEVRGFLEEIGGLRDRLGAILMQLPPTLEFDRAPAAAFFKLLRSETDVPVVCEPRHASWFNAAAARLLEKWRVGRVGADPARHPGAAIPAGDRSVAYHRLHGSPRMYYSSYDEEFLRRLAESAVRESGARPGAQTWCIFDNTVESAAWGNALAVKKRVSTLTGGRGG